MKDDNFRVDFIPTVPHYPSLAKALQNDMLATAIATREALYMLDKVDGLTGGIAYYLEKALISLDFPHFIPMANTNDALYQEYVNLKELVYHTPIDGYEFNKLAMQFMDVEAELEHRGFWTEIVLEDMTAVVLSIEIEASKEFSFSGKISKIRKLITKNNDIMAIVSVEVDTDTRQDIVVLPRTLATYHEVLTVNTQAQFTVNIDTNDRGEREYFLSEMTVSNRIENTSGAIWAEYKRLDEDYHALDIANLPIQGRKIDLLAHLITRYDISEGGE